MRNAPCNLRVKRPTPTTVSFTVSTRAPIETLTARTLHHAVLAARAILASFILLILWTKWCLFIPNEVGTHFPPWVHHSLPAQGSRWVAENVTASYLIPLAFVVLWAITKRGYTEESLLVLRGLGIQTTSSSPTYLSTATTRFIPTTSIQDIFIHEAFKGFEVRFYLAIVVKEEQDVVVVFPNLLPSLSILEEVWRGARSCLYEPKS